MSFYNQMGFGRPPPQQPMRSSQEQMMRSSAGSTGSNHSQYSKHSQYSQGGGYGQPGANQMRSSWDKRTSASSSIGGSRDSRSSRGSQDGLRMSSGPEMAGVGIFFQQEPTSGRVYVANIVENGSADRSGVIRVNDVIVKVDDEDVQGQPLSTLRNLILGRQGSYVVLAFRRMTGTELYYFDVELVRGTPEYFESLKKSQAVADEKEKLLMQVRQQEQDIRALKQQSQVPTPTKSPMSEGPGADIESIKRAIAAKSEEIVRMEAALQRERGQSVASTVAAEQALVQLRAENKRLGDTLSQETQKYEDLKQRAQQQANEWQEAKQRMQAALKAEIGSANSAHAQNSSGLDSENDRLRKELNVLDQRDQQAQQALRQAHQVVGEVTRNNEANLKLLQELVPAFDSMFSSVFVSHGLDPSAHMQGRA
eukprot:Tamp_15287.p2 GENE.Tamp_15287~~Tamp_15287.p2  ORF type:complete len:424 (-),score=134.88 Tamp_15287:243-1514(-)